MRAILSPAFLQNECCLRACNWHLQSVATPPQRPMATAAAPLQGRPSPQPRPPPGGGKAGGWAAAVPPVLGDNNSANSSFSSSIGGSFSDRKAGPGSPGGNLASGSPLTPFPAAPAAAADLPLQQQAVRPAARPAAAPYSPPAMAQPPQQYGQPQQPAQQYGQPPAQLYGQSQQFAQPSAALPPRGGPGHARTASTPSANVSGGPATAAGSAATVGAIALSQVSLRLCQTSSSTIRQAPFDKHHPTTTILEGCQVVCCFPLDTFGSMYTHSWSVDDQLVSG